MRYNVTVEEELGKAIEEEASRCGLSALDFIRKVLAERVGEGFTGVGRQNFTLLKPRYIQGYKAMAGNRTFFFPGTVREGRPFCMEEPFEVPHGMEHLIADQEGRDWQTFLKFGGAWSVIELPTPGEYLLRYVPGGVGTGETNYGTLCPQWAKDQPAPYFIVSNKFLSTCFTLEE
jgi:hypothetical protein